MAGLEQHPSFPHRVVIKNTFIDLPEAHDDLHVPMTSCPLAHFATQMIASTKTPHSEGCAAPFGDASNTLNAFLLGISTPTGSQSLDLLTAFGREVQKTPCKVGEFPIGISTPTGSQSLSGILSAFGVPKVELPRCSIRVKNTFVESGDEEECVKEEHNGLKTCPPLQFHSLRFLPSGLKDPVKVELPPDFLDAHSLSSLDSDQMSRKSTSVGSESDAETERRPSADVADARSATSQGSALHEAGTCEPCAWFWKPEGCRWGQNCVRCHICPEGEVKERRKQKLAAARAQRRV